MEKFLKSFFSPSDKRKDRFESGSDEDKHGSTPQLDGRRKLSISRSGRMRQANKKRHSLSLELYGENYQTVEKPKSMEYHVKNPVNTEPKAQRRRSVEPKPSQTNDKSPRRESVEIKTPEEEIETAFEIIDKIS